MALGLAVDVLRLGGVGAWPAAPGPHAIAGGPQDPAVGRDTVGPALCDAMMALAVAHDGQAIQAAFRLRWFYLTVPKPRDQFRLGSLFRSLDGLEQEAGQVLHDIQIVHQVIDRLHG